MSIIGRQSTYPNPYFIYTNSIIFFVFIPSNNNKKLQSISFCRSIITVTGTERVFISRIVLPVTSQKLNIPVRLRQNTDRRIIFQLWGHVWQISFPASGHGTMSAATLINGIVFLDFVFPFNIEFWFLFFLIYLFNAIFYRRINPWMHETDWSFII